MCKWEVKYLRDIPCFLSNKEFSREMRTEYRKLYENIADDDLTASILPEGYLKLQAEQMAKYIKENITQLDGYNLADIGSGKGYFINNIIKLNLKSISAIDISLKLLLTIENHKKIKKYLANAENLPFYDQFHIITTSDVIEHVVNLGNFMVSLNNSLKKGGWLFVRTPMNENLLKYTKLYKCKYDFVHLRNFNKEILMRIMKDSGFRVKKIYYDGFWDDKIKKIWEKPYFNTFKQLVINSRNSYKNINQTIGCLFFEPTEIIVIAQKVSNITAGR